MKYYLYQITNKVNGKIYVGVHKTHNVDDGYMGSGKVIRVAIEKYGAENFHKEILEVFDDAADAFEREKEIVNEEFLARDDVYNLRRGGSGGFDYINSKGLNIQRDMTNNWRGGKAVFQKYGGIPNSVKWTKRPENGGFGGRKHSELSKERIGEANKKLTGERNSQFGTIWITNGLESRKIRGPIPEGWTRGRVSNGD